jgi:hypothetical protein
MNRRVRLLFSIDFQWSICMHRTREGDDWILKHGRRKFGRVFRDSQYPGMWSRGRHRLPCNFPAACAFSVLQSDRVAVRLEGQSSHAATDHAVRANVVEKRIDHVTPRRPICIPLDGHRDVINHDEHEEYYANHGQNLEKNIFTICHEIT